MDNPLIKSTKNTNYSNTKNDLHNMSTDDKLTKIKSDIGSIKVTMQDNFDKVIERGENIEVLNKKAESLSDSATKFGDRSRKLRRKMCIENAKKNIIIFLFVLLVLIIIVCIIYFGSKN